MLEAKQIKSFPSIIAFGYVQRAYPYTHCSNVSESKGSQGVESLATHDIIYELKGTPCISRVSNGDEFVK